MQTFFSVSFQTSTIDEFFRIYSVHFCRFHGLFLIGQSQANKQSSIVDTKFTLFFDLFHLLFAQHKKIA